MMFLRLIAINLGRHRTRTLISVAGIAFSVAAMLTVVTVLEGAVGMFSGILSSDSEVIVFERNVSDLFFSSVPEEAASRIASWPLVAHADPVLFGIVSSRDHPIITCFGITADDARLRKAVWIEGDRSAFGRSPDSVVLGERAAGFLAAANGGTVQIGRGQFRVAGILRTANGFEDGGVFMPLAAAQSFFHKEHSSSVITVKLRRKEDAGAFRRALGAAFPGLIALEDAEFNRTYSQFRILKATAWAVGGCGLVLGGLGVANTMIMSVFTRIREIAILRVCGLSNLQIAALIFGESLLVADAGAVLGLLIGFLVLVALKRVPALHGYIDVAVQAGTVAMVIALALLTGVAGALYPAGYAMRVRAVEALRFE
jgi:putative ABC transport system permease protein